MRVLFALPHYFNPDSAGNGRHGSLRRDPAPRIRALADCLTTIQQLFGQRQCVMDLARRTTTPANESNATADVIVCTSNGQHLLDRLKLDSRYYTHRPTND